MTFKTACMICYEESKKGKIIPFRTGRLKFHAMSACFDNDSTYHVKFDGKVAPYIEFLENGTNPHDIPKAFGRPLPFGIGGRFNGKFHPGSYKHWMFIERTVADYATRLAIMLKGEIR